VDPTGAAVGGAQVNLTRGEPSTKQQAFTGDDGQFYFGNIAPGPFQITVTLEGFATKATSGMLHPGEIYVAPQIALALAAKNTDMVVAVSGVEVAEEQIKEEEKQRVLGFVPNFYVTYIPDAAPLTPKQKFRLALRVTVDPVTIALTGALAGVQQSQNYISGYGQGAAGYGKRFGADYAQVVTDTLIGDALLPSILKQDPRFFYKADGSVRSRIWYALEMAVVCKGDNGRWQPNYSNILGDLAGGALSNLYYPAQNRNGAAVTFENAAIHIGTSAVANLLQEFVIRKLTPNANKNNPGTP
jgi:hypothetical protein